jgi:hypothetical protein
MSELKRYNISTYLTLGVSVCKLHTEIDDASCVTNFGGVSSDGTEVIIYGDSFINETTLDTTITNHDPFDLEQYKLDKNEQIDSRTSELIGTGFTFDSEQFSLSQPAQINWMGLKTMQALLTWPVTLTTTSDTSYDLEEANLDNFVGTGSTTVQTHLASGRTLKESVLAATDKAGVDAVVDTR